jgi:hypothetical protein
MVSVMDKKLKNKNLKNINKTKTKTAVCILNSDSGFRV